MFSQFLFDNQIKSQLIREIAFYRDNIDELNQMVDFCCCKFIIDELTSRGNFSVSTEERGKLQQYGAENGHIGGRENILRQVSRAAHTGCFEMFIVGYYIGDS